MEHLTIQHFRELKAANRLSIADIEEACRSLPQLLTREAVAVLCEIAGMPEEQFRAMGQRALFGSIAEPLGDSFEPANVPIYDRVFAQVIEDSRRRPGGERLDETLSRFQIHSEQDLVRRKTIFASSRPVLRSRDAVRKAFVISRITLGADVAVSSVIVQSLMDALPNATITLIAPPGTRELFVDTPRFKTLPIRYPRHGSLLDRLLSWVDLVKIIDEDCKGFRQDETIIVDPDSRLTQLGLLPLVEDETRYFFFDSRSCRKEGVERLGQLAAQWGREVFEQDQEVYPFVRLATQKTDRGKLGANILRSGGRKGVVSMNFGFGGNPMKQLGLEFEAGVALQALDQGFAVILDKGIGEELDRANLVVARLKAAGKKVFELQATSANSVEFPLDADVITWEGDAAGFASLIAASDIYIGYDSAFQHIAAALGIPVVDIFAQASSRRFRDRWTPHSTKPVFVVDAVDRDSAAALRAIATLLRDILRDWNC